MGHVGTPPPLDRDSTPLTKTPPTQDVLLLLLFQSDQSLLVWNPGIPTL